MRVAGARAEAPAAPPAPVLTLPFDGVWGVLQGFEGDTHRGYAAFAIDFAPPQDVGAFARLAHPRLEDFACYGRPVLAPADGRVVRVATRFPDLPPYAHEPKRKPRPGTHETLGGNFVIIQHAPRVYTELVHLQAGSVRVTVGQGGAPGRTRWAASRQLGQRAHAAPAPRAAVVDRPDRHRAHAARRLRDPRRRRALDAGRR